MDRKNFRKIIGKTLLFLLGVVLLVYTHWSNEQYKKKHDIDSTSGATELAE